MTTLARRVDGPSDGAVVVLGPSLGSTWEMWDGVAAALSSTYQVVRYDTRGHGRSPAPPGPYTVEELADDVLGVVDDLGVGRFGFVGLSLGGAIGQVLAARHADRVAAAVLCCTVPKFGDPAAWTERAALVRSQGMTALEESTRQRWFSDAFRAAQPAEVDRLIGMLTALDADGYASCCEALATFDARSRLGSIDVPVRVVAGSEDPVATADACRALAAAIPGADLVVLPGASHLASAEQPEAFVRAVTEHLERHL